MNSYWKFWCNAKNEKNADNTLKRFVKVFDACVEQEIIKSYHKGGFVVSFQVNHIVNNWNDYVIEVIGLAQGVGYHWVLSGNIFSDIRGWSNKNRISGIQSMQWYCDIRQ